MKHVSILNSIVTFTLSIQIAADYAKQGYDNFTVVIQPFVSNTRADKFPIDFLSDVSDPAISYIPKRRRADIILLILTQSL